MSARKTTLGLSLLGMLGLCALGATPGQRDVRLPLRFHHQEHELSCEAAALKMVFDYQGLRVSESEILERMPRDRTPHVGGVWGDPDSAFVGDVDGEMGVSGYGIHSRALGQLASHWRKTRIIRSGRLEDLITNLEQGRPLIVWGYTHSGKTLNWKTRQGHPVAALANEHARVVYGFRGEATAPTGFYVMDPRTGSRFWPRQEFFENWDSLGRAGIVVYREPPDTPTSGAP